MLLYTPKNRASTHTNRWIRFYKHFSWFIFSYFRGWCREPTPDIQRKERKSFILNFHVKFLISNFSFPFSFQVLIFKFSIFEFYTWKVFSFCSFFFVQALFLHFFRHGSSSSPFTSSSFFVLLPSQVQPKRSLRNHSKLLTFCFHFFKFKVYVCKSRKNVRLKCSEKRCAKITYITLS